MMAVPIHRVISPSVLGRLSSPKMTKIMAGSRKTRNTKDRFASKMARGSMMCVFLCYVDTIRKISFLCCVKFIFEHKHKRAIIANKIIW